MTTSGPSHSSRSQPMSASFSAASKRLATRATVVGGAFSEAKRSGSVVSMLAHHDGCSAMSPSVRSVGRGGKTRPLCTSRRREPATGTSTVSASTWKPAARARPMSSALASRSGHM